jgi:SAM-dependent methyltransferase
MGSVANLLKLFRGAGAEHTPDGPRRSAARISRRSSGLNEFTRSIAGREGLCILDLGSTSPANISRLTGLGHKVYTEDVLHSSYDRSLVVACDDGKTTTIDGPRFLSENLAHRGKIFDAVLAWDVPDYLPEPLVKPVIERLCATMKPGGVLLGFFHTRDAGPDAPHYRYHIAGNDMLELQPTASGQNGAPQFRLQRVFNNRHIENLFREFASLKFFLARDNVREVLVVR